MKKKAIAVFIAAAALVGCKKEEATPTTPPANAGGTPTKPSVMDQAKGQAADVAKGAAGEASKVADTAADLTKDAAKKLDDIKQLISDKKLDQADTALKALEAMKEKLPAAVQEQLGNVRSLLDKAKTAANGLNGVKAPEVPAIAK